MKSVRVKICGLTRAEDAHCALRNGADYLGFVFAESPRRVRPQEILPWLEELREEAELVGVFRNQTREEVARVVEQLDLDLVQLHGSEHGEEWQSLPVRVIEARAVTESRVQPSRLRDTSWATLLDSASPAGGGSGQVFPWHHAMPLAKRRRVFLSGGLTPENVVQAISQVHPFAVDVSSGVESAPGHKDPERLAAFSKAVHDFDEGRETR
jgi:phosphoribosylanthranilate isomerase